MISEFSIIGWGAEAMPWPYINWQFPLEVGKFWPQNIEGATVTTVVNHGEVVAAANLFSDSYLLRREWTGFNSFGRYDIWAVPEVGIVRQHLGEFCTVCSQADFTSTWELIDWFGKPEISR